MPDTATLDAPDLPAGASPLVSRADLLRAFEPTRVAVAAGALPCAVIGVADATGDLALEAVPGPHDRAEVDSVFFLASVTKPIVAAAVMQLVDEGRLDLHAPIARYVPAFTGAGKGDVTAWHVLTHTAGIRDIDLEVLRRKRPTYARLLERICSEELDFEPGARYAYASDSFLLLAEAIARLTGMPFAAALRHRLLAPLVMVDTVFDARPRRSRLMPVHGVALGNPIIRELILRFLARATLPGGGLFSTAQDLLHFGRSLLPRTSGAGPRVLSQAAIDEMTREQTMGLLELNEDGTTRDPRYALGWGKPRASGRVPSATDVAEDSEITVPASPSTFTHGGASGTRLWIDPDRELVFVFLTNSWGISDAPMYATLAEVYRAWDAARA